ncbi:MAG: hypothetical protein ACR2MZ_13510 [Candidatus Dormibacter sp.]|uniref:hypothetical protein n=1 Tax=Candidatus Dormibacter sp. TaxID=2973982 RepID=UPI000DB857D6|nr:MAG: hypothetical protein DLM66_09495 [Candidatus Dormibacteraeota bacterium]
MLEVVVGLLAALLILTGVLVMAGPNLRRGLQLRRHLPRPGPLRAKKPSEPGTELHPTMAKALKAADRAATLLADNRQERQAAALRQAAQRALVREADGIYALQAVLRRIRSVQLTDSDDQRLFAGLVRQATAHLNDRAEQLELLPRR